MNDPQARQGSQPPVGASGGFGRPGAAGAAGLLKLGAVMRGAPQVDHPKPERLLRGNPTARSERYTEVLERLKKRLDTHTHR